jgi:chemotaxis protein methyltransferase CheR
MGEIRPLTDEEFALFQRLVEREAGIHLSEAKRMLLAGRLSGRLRELGLDSFTAYYRLVTRVDPAERVQMLDRMCTNATQFFREPAQYGFLEEQVFPRWEARAQAGSMSRGIRVWSAACSTGEEPYSVAMVLLNRFPPGSGWSVEVLATDLSSRALDQARSAVWPVEKSSEIPSPYLKRFMLRGTRGRAGQMKAGPELRAAVRFARLNLNDEAHAVGDAFDLIFCRNVLIYFGSGTKAKAVQRLLTHLTPDGYLLLGHAETMTTLGEGLRRVGPSAYVRAADASEPAESSVRAQG